MGFLPQERRASGASAATMAPSLPRSPVMSINWFPGHMSRAIKDIKDLLPKVDLIIEVLDARIPYSSANPVIEQFRGGKPSVKLLSTSRRNAL